MPLHMFMISQSYYACNSGLSSSKKCRDAEKVSEKGNKGDQKYETASVWGTTRGREQNSEKESMK